MQCTRHVGQSILFLSLSILAACGGGGGEGSAGGGGDNASDGPAESPPTETYKIGGSVSGLNGTGLLLVINDGEELSVDDAGDFVFDEALEDGRSYQVTISSHPSGQVCKVDDGSGTVDGADVVSVRVECEGLKITAKSGLSHLALSWNAPDQVDIFYSSDPDCQWNNYAACPHGTMLTGIEGGSLSLNPVADDLPVGVGLYFRLVDERGHATDVSGARLLPPAFDGEVHAMAKYRERLYVGGDFSHTNMVTGGGVALDLSDGDPLTSIPFVDGTVRVAVSDGTGGWYIGGNFEEVAGEPRANLAHIEATGEVDLDWNPGTDNTVYALAVADGIVYAGGAFTAAGGSGRSRIAAFNAETGALRDNLGIGASNTVRALATDGDTVYVGGSFFTFGGNRESLAALDGATGQLKEWSPSTDGSVFALSVEDGIVYVGGEFEQAGGAPRLRLAAFDAETGALDTAWSPSPGGPNGSVLALDVAGDRLYAGGGFVSVGGYTRNRLAAFDIETGLLQPWRPSSDNTVAALSVVGDTVYVGTKCYDGSWCSSSDYLFAYGATGFGSVRSDWYPEPDGSVHALALSGDAIYAGGEFVKLEADLITISLAVLDANSGALLPEAFDIRGGMSEVRSLAVADDTLYAGGSFTYVNRETRSHLAAFNASTGYIQQWNPEVDNVVHGLAVHGGRLYAGGEFAQIDGVTRERLAAFTVATGTLDLNWNPGADGAVNTVVTGNGLVYVGGEFSFAGNESRERLAAFDTATGIVDADWNPGADGTVQVLLATDTTVYGGGEFLSAGGDSRSRLAAFDAITGSLDTNWNPGADATVYALAKEGQTVYAGGDFLTAGGEDRSRLAAFDSTSGLVDTSWSPGVDNSLDSGSSAVHVFSVIGDVVYTGGSFLMALDKPRSRFAAFNAVNGELVW